MLRSFLNDLKYASRALARTPVATLAAILSIALAIGMTTAIYGLIDSLLLRSLDVRDPQRLVSLSPVDPVHPPQSAAYPDRFSYSAFEEIKRQQTAFAGIAGWFDVLSNITAEGALFKGEAIIVTGDYFSTLGVSPLLGRTFQPDDYASPGSAAANVAVISYSCWKSRYHSDPTVLGRSIKVGTAPYTIVGVTRPNLSSLRVGISADVTVLLSSSPYRFITLADRDRENLWLIARLKNGMTLDAARAQMNVLWPRVLTAAAPAKMDAETRDSFWRQRLEVLPAGTGFALIRDRYRDPLFVALALVSLVLLIACSNLANLMLARMAARRHEISIRLALGASPTQVFRLVLTEGFLLSAVGTILALPFALRASAMIGNFLWTGAVPLTLDLRPDLRVLAFTTALMAVTGILVGVCAAYHAAKQNPSEELKHGAMIVGPKGKRADIGRILICAQIALSLTLISSAGLLTRSLMKLRATDPGFRADHVLALWLSPAPGGYANLDKPAYYRALLDRVSNLPGVKSATLSKTSPALPAMLPEPVAAISQDSEESEQIQAYRHTVAPRFFDTFGMSLVEGRDFTLADDANSAPVAIVSAGLAKKLFPSSPAVGQWIGLGTSSERQKREVVGVASDASLFNIRLHDPNTFYVPFFQSPNEMTNPFVQLRLEGGLPSSFANSAGKQISDLGHEYVWRAQTLSEQVDQSMVEDRLLGTLSFGFGIFSLLLAAMGVFGLISYGVNRRAREIGVRIALGADRGMIFWLVMGDSMRLALIGISVGFVLTLLTTRFIAHMLFQVSTTDPFTLVLAICTMFAVSMLASYIPANRATKVQPMSILRAE